MYERRVHCDTRRQEEGGRKLSADKGNMTLVYFGGSGVRLERHNS